MAYYRRFSCKVNAIASTVIFSSLQGAVRLFLNDLLLECDRPDPLSQFINEANYFYLLNLSHCYAAVGQGA